MTHTETTRQPIQRFDVVEILENALDLSFWKGDSHTRGIYFTELFGYAVNKILAIRIKHDEKAPDVFYSFDAQEDESVVKEYPFKELMKKPKNHHLLFDKTDIEQEEIDEAFRGPFTYGTFTVDPDSILSLLENVKNKRERERSFLSMHLENGRSEFEVVRKKSHQRITTFSEIIKTDEINPSDIVRAQAPSFDIEHLQSSETHSEKMMQRLLRTVNAQTMFHLLKLFSPLRVVHFLCGRDRIMITGDEKEMREKHMPNTEAVIALAKNI